MMKNNFNTSSGVYKVKTFGTIQGRLNHEKVYILEKRLFPWIGKSLGNRA